LEIDDPVLLLGPAALMAHRQAAAVVPAASPMLGAEQRLLRLGLRDLREVRDRAEAAPGGGRLILLERHLLDSLERRSENAAERLTLPEGDERLLPIGRLDGRAAAGPLRLAFDDHGIDRLHLAAPQLLHRAPDLDLVRLRSHFERILVVALNECVLLR